MSSRFAIAQLGACYCRKYGSFAQAARHRLLVVTTLLKGVSREETLGRRCCIDENIKLKKEEEKISKSTGPI